MIEIIPGEKGVVGQPYLPVMEGKDAARSRGLRQAARALVGFCEEQVRLDWECDEDLFFTLIDAVKKELA